MLNKALTRLALIAVGVALGTLGVFVYLTYGATEKSSSLIVVMIVGFAGALLLFVLVRVIGQVGLGKFSPNSLIELWIALRDRETPPEKIAETENKLKITATNLIETALSLYSASFLIAFSVLIIGTLAAIATMSATFLQVQRLSEQNMQIREQNQRITEQNEAIQLQNDLIRSGNQATLLSLQLGPLVERLDNDKRTSGGTNSDWVSLPTKILFSSLSKSLSPHVRVVDPWNRISFVSPEKQQLLELLVAYDIDVSSWHSRLQPDFSQTDLRGVNIIDLPIESVNLFGSDLSGAFMNVDVLLNPCNLNQVNFQDAIVNLPAGSENLVSRSDIDLLNSSFQDAGPRAGSSMFEMWRTYLPPPDKQASEPSGMIWARFEAAIDSVSTYDFEAGDDKCIGSLWISRNDIYDAFDSMD